MAEGNGNYDWHERMKRIEDSIERNWEDHERMERNVQALHTSMVDQKGNVDNLLRALRDLIDRIPPENLRP